MAPLSQLDQQKKVTVSFQPGTDFHDPRPRLFMGIPTVNGLHMVQYVHPEMSHYSPVANSRASIQGTQDFDGFSKKPVEDLYGLSQRGYYPPQQPRIHSPHLFPSANQHGPCHSQSSAKRYA